MTNRQTQSVPQLVAGFQAAVARQDWEAARSAGRQLARQLPDNASVAYNLGLAEKSAGAAEAAIAAFERALALDPDHHNARFELAGSLTETAKLAEARAHLETYLAQNPDDADARLNLGRILLRLDQPAAALACLEKANAPHPTDDTAIALATALRDLGRLDEAQALLDQLPATPDAAALRLKVMTQGARGRFSLAVG